MAKNPNNAADLRGKSADELAALVLELRKSQFNMRFQRATGPAGRHRAHPYGAARHRAGQDHPFAEATRFRDEDLRG